MVLCCFQDVLLLACAWAWYHLLFTWCYTIRNILPDHCTFCYLHNYVFFCLWCILVLSAVFPTQRQQMGRQDSWIMWRTHQSEAVLFHQKPIRYKCTVCSIGINGMNLFPSACLCPIPIIPPIIPTGCAHCCFLPARVLFWPLSCPYTVYEGFLCAEQKLSCL